MNHRTKRMFAGAAVMLMVACALFAVTFSDDEDVDAADSHTNKTGSNVSGTVGSSINSTVYTHSTVITSSVFQRYSVEQHNLPSSLGLSFSLSHSNNKMSLKLTGTPQENADTIRGVLSGRITGPRKDAIVLNAAGALVVGGKAGDFRDGVQLAREIIESGRAEEKLAELAACSNAVAEERE